MLRLPSDQTFFGLTPEYDRLVMDQCFDLGFHSQSCFTFDTAYDLPVPLRSYFYAKLSAILKARQEAGEAAMSKSKGRR